MPSYEKNSQAKSQAGRNIKPVESTSFEVALQLLDAVHKVSSKQDVKTMAYETSEQIVRLLQVSACAISEWLPESDSVVLWAEYSVKEQPMSEQWWQPFSLENFPLTRQVMETMQPVQIHIDDPTADQAEVNFMKSYGAHSLLMLPLVTAGRTIALIEVINEQEHRVFTEDEIALVQMLVNLVGDAMERTRLLAEANQRAVELEALHKASLSLTASLDLGMLLNAILESALQLSKDALDAHIYLYENNKLEFGAVLWKDGRSDDPWGEPRENGLTYTVARSGEIFIAPDMKNHPLLNYSPKGEKELAGAIIGLPLRAGQDVVGVMNVAYQSARQFTNEDIRILELFADQAALAITNARLHRLVMQQALTDPLTELANRRALDQALENEILRSQRTGTQISLVMLDLDGFKRVNDNYGHPIGDKTLQQVARCLLQSARQVDMLARFGGDEFALLLPQTGNAEATEIAERMKQTLEKCDFPWWQQFGSEFGLSLTFGVASFPEHANNAAELIQMADDRLYANKGTQTDENRTFSQR